MDKKRINKVRNFDPETIYKGILKEVRSREDERENQPNRNQVISRDLTEMKKQYIKDLAWLHYARRVESQTASGELKSLVSKSIEDLDLMGGGSDVIFPEDIENDLVEERLQCWIRQMVKVGKSRKKNEKRKET